MRWRRVSRAKLLRWRWVNVGGGDGGAAIRIGLGWDVLTIDTRSTGG